MIINFTAYIIVLLWDYIITITITITTTITITITVTITITITRRKFYITTNLSYSSVIFMRLIYYLINDKFGCWSDIFLSPNKLFR